MFFSKKKPSASYDPAVQRPALRCSICTGEQVAGFVHPDGHFEDETSSFCRIRLQQAMWHPTCKRQPMTKESCSR